MAVDCAWASFSIFWCCQASSPHMVASVIANNRNNILRNDRWLRTPFALTRVGSVVIMVPSSVH